MSYKKCQASRLAFLFLVTLIVPTRSKGMPQGTLRVPATERDAERPGLHSFAARGNDQGGTETSNAKPSQRSAPYTPEFIDHRRR
jgi:hypothetical protein